jgi:hypothetical protein
MLLSLPCDLLHLTSELLSGKTLPVLFAIVLLPLDQTLSCVVLSLGAVCGALFSAWSGQATSGLGLPWAAFGNRLLQLLFSAVLSLSLLLGVSAGLAPSGGVILSLVPAYTVCSHSLPQRLSSPLLAFLLAVAALAAGFATPLGGRSGPPDGARRALVLPDPAGPLGQQAVGVWLVIGRALQLIWLAYYACTHHAPTQHYIQTAQDHRHGRAQYCSHPLAGHLPYATFVHLCAAWVRLSVMMAACLFQDNALHVLLEGDRAWRWDAGCCWILMASLLFSACWALTQLREQVLPYFLAGCDGRRERLRLLVVVLLLASLCRHGAGDAVLFTADALGLLSVVTALLTLRKEA